MEGNASTTSASIINAVISTVEIAVKILRPIANNALDLTSILEPITNLLKSATSSIIDQAGDIINVVYRATGIISGLSSSFSSIIGQITSTVADEALVGSIISGMSGITAGIGGALGDLMNGCAKVWGIGPSLGDIINEFSGPVELSAGSVGDVYGILQGIESEAEGTLQVVGGELYEAVEMISCLGTSFVVSDIISIIKSIFRCIDKSINTVTDDIGEELSDIIRVAMAKVSAALCNITDIVGNVTPDSVPGDLDEALTQLASAIFTLVGTLNSITGQTALILKDVKNAEALADAISSLSLNLAVVLLLNQCVLILISGALVIVTGTIDKPVHALTVAVVDAVQIVIEIISVIIGSLDDGACASFPEIAASLTDATKTIDLGVAEGVECVSAKVNENIFNCLACITNSQIS